MHDKLIAYSNQFTKVQVRVSIGSAVVLGLADIKIDVLPTTIYLLLGKRCVEHCKYCTQAKDSNADKKYLSRITWPRFELKDVLRGLKSKALCKRVCIQTLKYPSLLNDLVYLVRKINKKSSLPISVCINPADKKSLRMLRNAGVKRVGIGLDCAAQRIFSEIKPGLKWNEYIKGIKDAVDVFSGEVSVHLIVGLGETDAEFVSQMEQLFELGAYPVLFAFTQVNGIALEAQPPPLKRYRKIQVAHWLITHGLATSSDIEFDEEELKAIKLDPAMEKKILCNAFKTTGCCDCNRPYYNEKPRQRGYNYPRELTQEEIARERKELNFIFRYRKR